MGTRVKGPLRAETEHRQKCLDAGTLSGDGEGHVEGNGDPDFPVMGREPFIYKLHPNRCTASDLPTLSVENRLRSDSPMCLQGQSITTVLNLLPKNPQIATSNTLFCT